MTPIIHSPSLQEGVEVVAVRRRVLDRRQSVQARGP